MNASPRRRRDFLRALAGAALSGCAPARSAKPDFESFHSAGSPEARAALANLEARVKGRVGVFAFDTASGAVVAHREDERFAMCSTFKWTLAAATLEKVDRAELSLDELVAYGTRDLVEHAPITETHVAEGAMTVDALARAAVTVSDNTAANLLLRRLGGPPGLTAAFRRWGDSVSRLDRTEPSLNENAPGDPRDSTSPRAMAGLLESVLCGNVLSRASRERLLGYLRDCETGHGRLRAGLPSGAAVGDKTGTGGRGACNDVAIVSMPSRRPVVIAAYLSDSDATIPELEAAHGAIARLVSATLRLAVAGSSLRHGDPA